MRAVLSKHGEMKGEICERQECYRSTCEGYEGEER